MHARNYLFIPFLLVAYSLYPDGPGGAGGMRKPAQHTMPKEDDNGNRLKFRSAEQVEQERKQRSPVKYKRKRYTQKKPARTGNFFGITYKQEAPNPKKTLSTMNFDELKIEKERILKNKSVNYDNLRITEDGILYTTESPFYKPKRFQKNKEVKNKVPNKLCGIDFTLEREPMPGLVKQSSSVDYEVAIKYLDRMRKLAEDAAQVATLTLELGDAYFELERYVKAITYYDDFIAMYPGHEQLEYVLYKNTLANYLTIHTLDRDQAPTKKTIDLTDQFLEKKYFTKYVDQIKTVRKQCFDKLVEHELYVCTFYLNSGYGYKGVQQRLESVEEMLKEVPYKQDAVLVCQERLHKVYKPTMKATPEVIKEENKQVVAA